MKNSCEHKKTAKESVAIAIVNFLVICVFIYKILMFLNWKITNGFFFHDIYLGLYFRVNPFHILIFVWSVFFVILLKNKGVHNISFLLQFSIIFLLAFVFNLNQFDMECGLPGAKEDWTPAWSDALFIIITFALLQLIIALIYSGIKRCIKYLKAKK